MFSYKYYRKDYELKGKIISTEVLNGQPNKVISKRQKEREILESHANANILDESFNKITNKRSPEKMSNIIKKFLKESEG